MLITLERRNYAARQPSQRQPATYTHAMIYHGTFTGADGVVYVRLSSPWSDACQSAEYYIREDLLTPGYTRNANQT